MADKNWGTKRVCLGCNARFYDFNKSPIICPSCGLEFDPDYLSKRKSRPISDKADDDIVIDDMIVEVEDDEIVDLGEESGADVESLGDDSGSRE